MISDSNNSNNSDNDTSGEISNFRNIDNGLIKDKDKKRMLLKEESQSNSSMSPISIGSPSFYGTPIGTSSPMSLKYFKSPSAYEIGDFKEKIQHLGWISTPNGLNKTRQRSNSMAIGSPGSITFMNHQIEDLSRQLEEKEKDIHLAAEIGRVLLEKNQDLEEKLSHFSDLESKYLDDSSNLSFLKNQNELLNGTLKEAEIENELLFEKLKGGEQESSRQFLSSHRLNNRNKSGDDLEKLTLEIEELKVRDNQREKNLQKARNEKEILYQKIHSLEGEISSSQESLREIDGLKEKNRKLSIKNKTLKSFSEINVRKSIVEEFNILKGSCQITLDKMISSSNSMIKEFSVQNEIEFFSQTKKLLDSFEINSHMNEPIVIQLIQRLKELDNSSTLEIQSATTTILKSSGDGSDSILVPSAETSSNNLIRSSLLLIISMYMMNRQKEFDDKMVLEKCKIKELIEDFNELKEKLQSSSKLNSKLELQNLSSINEIESFKNQLKDANDSIQILRDQHQKEIEEIQQQQDGNASKQLESKDIEIITLRERLQQLEQQIQSKDTQIKDLTEKEMLLNNEITQIKSQDCKECIQLKDSNTSLRKDRELMVALEEELSLLKSKQCEKCPDLSNQLDGSNIIIDELKTKVLQQSNQLLQLQSNLQEEIDRLKNKDCQHCISKDSTIDDMKCQLNEKVNEIKGLETKYEEGSGIYISKMLSLEQNLLDQINTNNSYHSQFKQLEEKLKEQSEKKCNVCVDLQNQIKSLSDKEMLQVERIKVLESQLEQECKSSIDLRELIEILENRLKLECKSCLELKRLIEDLKNKTQLVESQLLQESTSAKSLAENLQLQTQKTQELNDRAMHLESKLQEECTSCHSLQEHLNRECISCVDYKQQIQVLHDKLNLECQSGIQLKNQLNGLNKDIEIQKQSEKEKLTNLENELQIAQKKQTEHQCGNFPVPDYELKLLRFIGTLINLDLVNLECRECSMKSLRDGISLSQLVNHYFSESIDPRALHKQCNEKQDYIDNISLVINSIKVLETSVCTSFQVLDIVDCKGTEIFKLCFEIVYNGLLNQFNLQTHPELSYFWKHNPEALEHTTTEKWENFMVLEPPYLLRRWVNHFLKQNNQSLVQNFNKDFKDFRVIHWLLTILTDYKITDIQPDSIMEYCKNTLNIGQLTTKDDIEFGNEQKTQVILSQLFIIRSGLDRLISSHQAPPMTNISPRQNLQRMGSANSLLKLSNEEIQKEIIAPSSEEKACKVWLKSIDVNISNLDDFRDGILLLKALDKVSNASVNWKTVTMNPSNTFQMTENCNYAVKIGKELKFSLVGIAGKDFVDCNKKFLLSFVWQMMRLYVLHRISLQSQSNQEKEFTENDLIRKLNQILSQQNKSSSIKSFSDPSLSNGVTLLDLLDAIKPGSIDYQEVKYDDSPDSKKSNTKYVISVSRRLGCSAIIFVEDIIEVKSNMILNFVCDLMTVTKVLDS
ncbi:actin binding protein [Tieghemostelium lacteum]|uniref:Actin binding protein n=1 Tax=Tieghemostelium lacteum TaxID=361077 RepID=A0A152A5I8_TIELA|nr:actin binding protein [Tieghemostelium lacteum]|eukprot:KYR01486.1 actin binding protein [Tieghemostelium lacteum]